MTNITKLTEKELKALGFDIIEKLNLLQNDLMAIKSELMRRNQEKLKENKKE